ncbi:PIF1 [Mytilus coruscus]|uniref:ATP-dependent DNA helicase n=1 Tax=Mytilus coruscus TaxID=42192 RepID=A0A6J8CI96_MYTCO|nr:PIF1 [Mytilus coruscus]
MFDEDQIVAFNLIKDGHNLLVSGQAGVGKTFLVKKGCKIFKKTPKKAEIVCSTGIAATHFSDLGAQKLHRWAGIENGRHMNEHLLQLVVTVERFISVKKNFLNVDVLFIDEISMISSKVLCQVEFLIRNVRTSTQYFGGVQIVLVGDFYQSPCAK